MQDSLIEVNSYIRTGVQGTSDSPISVAFSFAPDVLVLPSACTITVSSSSQIHYSLLYLDKIGSNFTNETNVLITPNNEGNWFFKKSQNGKIISWYNSKSILNSFNSKNTIYYCLGISTSPTKKNKEYIITKSTTFIVPYTGNYYLELYGGGGGAIIYRGSASDVKYIYTNGATSCQSYESVYLTKDSQINITIGKAGETEVNTISAPSLDDLNGGETTFGEYSCARGKGSYIRASSGTSITKDIRTGTGNLGTNGKSVTNTSSTIKANQSKGQYGNLFGIGGLASYEYYT